MKKTILRSALRLGPRSFRREFGLEIEADFEEGWREARERGSGGPAFGGGASGFVRAGIEGLPHRSGGSSALRVRVTFFSSDADLGFTSLP